MTVIALGKGTYGEQVSLTRDLTLWGACVAETVIDSTGLEHTLPAIGVREQGVSVRNLTVTGESPGIDAYGSDAALELEDVVVRDAFYTGVRAGSGAGLTARGLVVRDMREGLFETMESGIVVSTGSSASIERAVILRARGVGVRASGSATVLTLEGVAVAGTEPSSSDSGGRGLSVTDEARVEVAESVIDSSRQTGVLVFQDSDVTFRDVIVRDTAPLPDGTLGRGIDVQADARLVMSRTLVRHNTEVGLFVADGGIVDMTDVLVCDTSSDLVDGYFGRGLGLQGDARVDGVRVVFARNRDCSVSLFREGAVAVFEDVTVVDSLPRECDGGTCTGFGAGIGVCSYAGAHLEMTGFLITRSTHSGIQLAHGADPSGVSYTVGGTADLHDGVVSFNPIGANVQTEGFDIARLMDGVAYVDNERNLDMDELPVPELGVEP
jgi:hypothetical protein